MLMSNESITPKKDDSLPIEEILKRAQENSDATNVANEEVKKEVKNTTDSTITKPEIKNEPVEELSPLEKLKRAEAERKSKQSGIIVDNEEMAKYEKLSSGPKENFAENDERIQNVKNTINEWDKTIELRKHVVLTKDPVNQLEYLQMITEFDYIDIDENGDAYIKKDPNGNLYELKYLRLRGENDGLFDFDNNENLSNLRKDANENDNKPIESSAPIDSEKDNTIEVIIDKTGLGGDFAFTPEEREKLDNADMIKLRQVKIIDINSIKARKSEKSFQDVVKEYDLSGQRTSICFPASGFRAQMKGMTYGEYSDIAMSYDNPTFDEYYKRLTVIYNKMTNISTGPFDSFEDFLKKFAYTDIPLAIYGLLLSTESDNDIAEIGLTCGNTEVCGLGYNSTYNRRSLLRLNKCHKTFLDKMKKIATADAMDFDKIAEEAIVNQSTYVQLPDSNFIVEIGIASAYDFLYNFIPLMDEETFKEEFGEDFNQTMLANTMLLTSVRSIRIPDGDEWIECLGYKDILRALYRVSTFDIKVITNYASKFQDEYRTVFSLGRVECPHCHYVTEDLEFSIDELVFSEYQRLMSTEIQLPE